MLSFSNTEIAFKHRSSAELKEARRLFKLFAYPFIVEKGPLLAQFALQIGLPIKGIIKATVFKHFCGGEDIESSHAQAQQLYARGVGSILDYSVEGNGNEKSYERSYKELLQAISKAAEHEEYPFAVFKCTGIGPIDLMEKVSGGVALNDKERKAYQRFTDRVEALCKRAYDLNIPLFIDAEESWIQPALDQLTYDMMLKFNKERAIIFNTIQLYRKGRIEEMEKHIAEAEEKGYYMGYKLVRGAYMEKERERAEQMNYPSPIQDTKTDTDRDYDRAVTLCFDKREIVSLCAGTHNEESSALLAELMKKNGLDPKDERFWFAQLFGMSDHISFNLADEGFNVAKYLPYGPVKDVLPYLARRAKENSSVRGQAGRELSLISKEIERRLGQTVQ